MKVLCRRVALTLSVVAFANSSIQRAERRAICLDAIHICMTYPSATLGCLTFIVSGDIQFPSRKEK